MKILLHNGKIWTGGNSFVHCLGFDSISGKITFTGFLLSGKKLEYDLLIDLKGKVVLPSFFEGHCHLRRGSEMKNEINLKGLSYESEIKEKLQEYIAGKKDGWVTGGYFTESDFAQNFIIDRYFIDDAAPDIPVYLSRIDLHSAVINSKAIELSGIKNKLNDFSKDEIILDAKGEMTGEIKERAMEFVYNAIPKVSPEVLAGYVIDEIKYMNSLGITHVTDITLPEDLDAYRILFEKYSPEIFINSVLPFESFNEFHKLKFPLEKFGDKIQFCSFKAFYDGSLSSQSAYFKDNYKNSENCGSVTEIVKSGDFERIGMEIDEAGYQILVHAIGDRAVKETLDFAEKLVTKHGRPDRRFRIEHCQHILPEDIKRFAELNVIASVQPAHLYVDAAVAEEKLNDTSTLHSYKKILAEKGILIFGTDFPVAPENPFETIYYAMSRKTAAYPDGFNKPLSLDLVSCLTAYTANNAYAAFQDSKFGKLEKGYEANFIVLDNDIFKAKINEIKDTKVEKTFYKGKLIYER
jgi:hypothetical protein